MLRSAVARQVQRQTPASYPRYAGKPRGDCPGIAPRTLLPLARNPRQHEHDLQHELELQLQHKDKRIPAPHPPPRSPPPGWTVSAHAAPAAYPRSMPQALGSLARDSAPFAVPFAAPVAPAAPATPATRPPATSRPGPGHPPATPAQAQAPSPAAAAASSTTAAAAAPPHAPTTTQADTKAEETKEERNARVAAERDACIAVRRAARFWPLEEALATPHPPLWVSAERWAPDAAPASAASAAAAPTSPPGEPRATLVFTHALGLTKEHWRPVLRHLLPLLAGSEASGEFGTGRALSSPAPAPAIDDLWLLEDTNHGASVDLNAGALGPAVVWDDSARELLNFVEHVLPAVPRREGADFALPYAREAGAAGAADGAGGGEGKRRVIGVGHSYGANALVQAAHAWPGAFDALLLIEPMTIPVLVNGPGAPLTTGALRRRAMWPSREAAAAVRGNALFGRWDEEQFQEWLDALVPVPGVPGAVQLPTPTWAEAQSFSEPDAPMRGWNKLPDLDIPVGFVMAGDETWMTGEDVANELVWRPRRPRNERIMAASHLVIQEQPLETARAIDRFLRSLPTWEQQ